MTILHFEIMFGPKFFSHCVTLYFLFQFENSLRIWGAYICTVRIRYTHKKRLSSQKEDAAQKKIAWLSLSLAGRKTVHSTTPKRKLFLFELNAILCFVYLSH